MIKRQVISAAVFALGMIISLGAVGSLDYAMECRLAIGMDELWTAVIKGIVGLALMAAGTFAGHGSETDEESKTEPEKKENHLEDLPK